MLWLDSIARGFIAAAANGGRDCLALLPAASGARGATAAGAACGGFGFALNAVATFDFAPASHEVPSPPRFLVLNSRPLSAKHLLEDHLFLSVLPSHPTGASNDYSRVVSP